MHPQWAHCEILIYDARIIQTHLFNVQVSLVPSTCVIVFPDTSLDRGQAYNAKFHEKAG